MRLSDALEQWGALEVADLVMELPGGCAFWRSTGGPLAWSDTQHMLARIDLRLREQLWQGAGKKGAPKPEPMKPPPFAHEAEVQQVRLSEAQRRFEERFG